MDQRSGRIGAAFMAVGIYLMLYTTGLFIPKKTEYVNFSKNKFKIVKFQIWI